MTDTLPTAREAQVVARAATWADADQLAATLGRAFHDDPLICFLLPDEASRPQKMPRLFKLLFKLGLPHGCCDVTTGCEAAALWRPPGAWHIPFYQYITNGAEFLGIFGLGGARPGDLRHGHHREAPRRTSRTTICRRSAPTRQAGQGLRRRRHPPASGRSPTRRACLPTWSPRKETNIPIYKSFGFEVTGEIKLPDGPTLWPMWRQASVLVQKFV